MGLKKLSAEPAEGRSTQVRASAGSGQASWQVFEVYGAQDWTQVSGLTLMLAMACRHSAQRHRRLQGSRSPWR